jgi:AcrR family transcriptional regulator
MMKKVNKQQLTHRQRQALETQKIILAAARELFLEQGYGATTIDSISEQAGVSVSTVYTIYKNKRGILRAIREDWHLQSAQREIYQQATETREPEQKLQLAAHATRQQWETSLAMITIYKGAASTDSEAAAELEQALDGRRRGIRQFIESIAAIIRSDISVNQAIAIYLALTRAELYQELVDIAGWSHDEYENWLATTLKQQLL